MIGNYTAEVVKRKWIEDFVDKSTGQVVSVDRYEKILDKGVLIDKENAMSLNFFLQSGDISEVVVSNQCRKGDLAINNHPYSFAVTISRREKYTEKNTKLLLMAESTDMATEIVKDFAELKYDGLFWIKEIKQVGSILIKDTLKKVDKSIEYLKDNIDMKKQIINTDEDNSEKKAHEIVSKQCEWIAEFIEENNLSKEDRNQLRFKTYDTILGMAEWKDEELKKDILELEAKNDVLKSCLSDKKSEIEILRHRIEAEKTYRMQIENAVRNLPNSVKDLIMAFNMMF